MPGGSVFVLMINGASALNGAMVTRIRSKLLIILKTAVKENENGADTRKHLRILKFWRATLAPSG